MQKSFVAFKTMQILLRKLLSFRFGEVWGHGDGGRFINLEFSDRMWAFLGVAHVDNKKTIFE